MSPLRFALCLMALLLMLAGTRPAQACKCGLPTEGDLAGYTVFAGTVVEYLQRHPDPSPVDGYNAVTRILVEYSKDVPVGSSVIVLGNHNSNCDAWFTVGGRALVVAQRVGEFFTTSKCLQLFDKNETANLRRRVNLPNDYFAFDITPRPPSPERCSQPATVDDAFSTAAVVAWTQSRAACVVPGTDEVEHALVMRQPWKGAALGDVLRVRVKGRPDLAYEDFAFFDELVEARRGTWPPAEFLRREGDLLINDGCLNPRPPASLAAGNEALKRLFPLPADYPQRVLPHYDDPLPRLSCATLDQSFFERSDKARAEWVAEKTKRQAAAPLAAAPVTTPARGSCAGCAIVAPTDSRDSAVILALLSLAAFCRFRGRARALAFGACMVTACTHSSPPPVPPAASPPAAPTQAPAATRAPAPMTCDEEVSGLHPIAHDGRVGGVPLAEFLEERRHECLLRHELRDFVRERQGCSTDADCVKVQLGCFISEASVATRYVDDIMQKKQELTKKSNIDACTHCGIGPGRPICSKGQCDFEPRPRPSNEQY